MIPTLSAAGELNRCEKARMQFCTVAPTARNTGSGADILNGFEFINFHAENSARDRMIIEPADYKLQFSPLNI